MPINRYICPYFSIVHKKNTNEYYENATKWWVSTYSCPSKCVACCNVTYLSDISKMFSKFTNVVQNGCFWCPRYWLSFEGQIGEDFSLILGASNIVTIFFMEFWPIVSVLMTKLSWSLAQMYLLLGTFQVLLVAKKYPIF